MVGKRVRELNGNGKNSLTFSSGITVELLPFPARLWEDINAEAIRRFPDPIPPKKIINVLDGTEEIDNLDDPEYEAKIKRVGQERSALILEAIIEFCPQIDLPSYEQLITRIEKYSPKFPDDPDDRRITFLTSYVIRDASDYSTLFMTVVKRLIIDDPEVAERVNSFQGDLERAIAAKLEASGATQGKRLEIREKTSRT